MVRFSGKLDNCFSSSCDVVLEVFEAAAAFSCDCKSSAKAAMMVRKSFYGEVR